MKLPTKVVLTLHPRAKKHRVEVDGERLGEVFADEDADGWTVLANGDALTGEGPFEAIGMALDEHFGLADAEIDDSDEDDDDEPQQDEDEDADEPEEKGRKWHVVSDNADSVTRAMEVRGTDAALFGCLVSVELWGSDGEYTSSTVYLPGVSLDDLRTETP